MLRAARSAGLKTALLSNSWDFAYPWDELDPLLDVKIVSGEVGLRKPDPAIYRLAGGPPRPAVAECAFVDDIEPTSRPRPSWACSPCCTPTWPRRWPRSSDRRPRTRDRTCHRPDPSPAPNSQEADVSDSPRKVALVTGAARGIGAATALRLARDGYAVGVLDLDVVRLCRQRFPRSSTPAARAVAVGADVGDAVAGRRGRRAAASSTSATRRCWSTTPASPATTCCSR